MGRVTRIRRAPGRRLFLRDAANDPSTRSPWRQAERTFYPARDPRRRSTDLRASFTALSRVMTHYPSLPRGRSARGSALGPDLDVLLQALRARLAAVDAPV